MSARFISSSLFIALALSACSLETSSKSFSTDDINEGNVTGQIDGQPWMLMTAVVEPSGTDLSISLYSAQVQACDAFASNTPMVMFTVPAEAGEYKLNFSLSGGGRTATFVPSPGSNVIATEGLIVVESVADGTLKASLVIEAGDSDINGHFMSTICGASAT